MKCKHCGANLPSDAKFCDICGTPIKRQSFAEKESINAKKRKQSAKMQKIGLLAAAAGVVLLIVTLWYLFYPKVIQFDPNLYNMKVKVSEEELEQIEIGMTYDEICDIVGGRGKLEEIFGGAINGAKTYAWAGEAMDKQFLYSSLQVSFDNRTKKADWIKARSIKNSDKIYTGYDTSTAGKTIIEDVKNPPIKDGMTYEEVVKALGREGLLLETDVIKDLMKDDVYEEHRHWYLQTKEVDDLDWEDFDNYENFSNSLYLWFENGKLVNYDRYKS